MGKAGDIADPEIDYEKMPGSKAEKRLAELFAPVDERIEFLVQDVVVREVRPDDDWYSSLAISYPWVSGIAVLDREGQVVERFPSPGVKPLFPEEFLALSPEWQLGGLKAVIKDTDFGPEVYLVRANFENNEWQGLLVVHFDPRILMRYSPDPESLLVFTAQAPLWPTMARNQALPLLTLDWEDTLESKIHGKVRAEGRKFTWLARALGDTHIIYAVPNKPETF
jgi:hypothetical protein